jgi:hypothetical protein
VTCRPPRKPGNIEKKKKIPCTLPTKTKRYSGSIIQFIGGGSVIVGGEPSQDVHHVQCSRVLQRKTARSLPLSVRWIRVCVCVCVFITAGPSCLVQSCLHGGGGGRSLVGRNWQAQMVWMCAKVRSLSLSRSSRIWSYAVLRTRLLEDLRVARMTDPLNARGPESVGGSAAAVDERRETMKSGGRVQARKDAVCWLGCGRANITEAGTRGRRAVIAPRERKSRRTYTPRASPTRARALWIPGAMGRCRRCTPIWSKDGRLCACGLCPRNQSS